MRPSTPRSSIPTLYLKLLGLINLKALEFPIRVFESGGILGDEVFACAWTVILARVNSLLSSPGTTEIDVCDDALVLEVITDITPGAREIRKSFAPRRGVGGGAVPDVCRYG